MKIALIGDLQYKAGEEAAICEYMRQVRAWQPDLAVSMGDMGENGWAGTREGMRSCKGFLDILPCEKAVLLGNHDVEYRPDDDTRLRTPEKWRREVFGGDAPWRAIEAGGFFLLCLSVERQPDELLLSQHALYSSPEQLKWARAQLHLHKNWPTIVFSHAPCAGSGLRCCPPVHHAATDAFMGQDFDPHCWKQLLQDNPQIFLWCSAHFHMGHGYARAISTRMGATHVSCGVMTSCARDSTRQTRLLELKDDGSAVILTMDHLQGGAVSQDCIISPDNPLPDTSAGLLIGSDRALRAWNAPGIGRAYIATEAGRLWEYDRALDELTGTICTGAAVSAAAMFGDRLYVHEAAGPVFSVSLYSEARFDRLSGYVPQQRRAETAMPEQKLRPISFEAQSTSEGEYILLHF